MSWQLRTLAVNQTLTQIMLILIRGSVLFHLMSMTSEHRAPKVKNLRKTLQEFYKHLNAKLLAADGIILKVFPNHFGVALWTNHAHF